MPFQPINFANIAPIGKPWARNFADNLKQGMEMGALPQKLLREQEQERIANALKQNELNYAPRMSEGNLIKLNQENEWNPRLHQSLIDNRGANTAYTNMQTQWMPDLNRSLIANQGANTAYTNLQTRLMPETSAVDNAYKRASTQALGRPQSVPGQMAYDHQKIIAEHGAGSPQDLMFQNFMQQAQDKALPQHERHLKQIQRLYAQREDPNTNPKDLPHINRTIAEYENKLERTALGPQVYSRLNMGKELQTAIDDVLKPRYIGKNAKGQHVYGNAPIDDATMFSGQTGWTARAKEAWKGTDDYRRYKSANDMLKKINHLYTNFEGLSVTPGAEAERLKLFMTSGVSLDPNAANKNARSYLSAITRGHQTLADAAREDAGLPVKGFDVSGRRREVPNMGSYNEGALGGTANISQADRYANYNQPPLVPDEGSY